MHMHCKQDTQSSYIFTLVGYILFELFFSAAAGYLLLPPAFITLQYCTMISNTVRALVPGRVTVP